MRLKSNSVAVPPFPETKHSYRKECVTKKKYLGPVLKFDSLLKSGKMATTFPLKFTAFRGSSVQAFFFDFFIFSGEQFQDNIRPSVFRFAVSEAIDLFIFGFLKSVMIILKK